METPKYKTALIVGAGSGLSASLARLFARHGIRVALAARSIEKLGALCTETGALAFTCDATKVAACDRAKDVNHRRNVVVRNYCHSCSSLCRHQTGHERWRSVWIRTCDRNVLYILQRIRAILWRLSRDLIADTILWVHPERG